MNIIDTYDQIFDCFDGIDFNKEKWVHYLNHIYPDFALHILDNLSSYNFEQECLPVIENMFKKQDLMDVCHQHFLQITMSLDQMILNKLGRKMNVDIVLYLSGCVAAGYATRIKGRNVVLLGIEKIIELRWEKTQDMCGLIYHELGHLYHDIYGNFLNRFDDDKDAFLWQLFSEGIAMYTEQRLMGDDDFYHQDYQGWKQWNQQHLLTSLKDFHDMINNNPMQAKHFFGDWNNYQGFGDVGYYLGARFIHFVSNQYTLDEMILFGIKKIEELFNLFVSSMLCHQR